MDSRTLVTILVTLLFWSSAFAGIRAVRYAYSPWEIAFVRFLLASAVFAVYALATRMRVPERRDWPALIAVGLLGVPVYHVALNYGELTVTAGAASLLVATTPIFTAVWATLFLRERLPLRAVAGIALSFFGAALISVGESRGHGIHLAPGALFVLLAAVAWSINITLQKPLLARYGALRVTMFSIWAGTASLLPVAAGLPRALAAAPPSSTLALVYMGIFPAALAYLTWGYTLARIPASRAASFLYLNPVFAIAIAWLWIHETPAGLSLIGGALALAGVVVANARAPQPAPPPDAPTVARRTEVPG